MSNKARWIQCYEKAERSMPEGTSDKELSAIADDMLAETEARATDEAYDRYRDDRLFRLKCDEPTT